MTRESPNSPSRRDLLTRAGASAASLLMLQGFKRDPLLDIVKLTAERCEHLREPARPIHIRHVNPYTATTSEVDWFSYVPGTEHLNFYAAKDQLKPGQLSAGPHTYVISNITETDIVSQKFEDCIGWVFVGTDLHTKKEAAFAIHADPRQTLLFGEQFAQHLKQRSTDFKQSVQPESIAIGFLAGRFDEVLYREHTEYGSARRPFDKKSTAEVHIRAMLFQSNIVFESFPGVMPVALTGPNLYRDNTHHMRFSPNGGSVGQKREIAIFAPHPSPEYTMCSMKKYFEPLIKEIEKRSSTQRR